MKLHSGRFKAKVNTFHAFFEISWNWIGCFSRLNSPMAIELCTKLKVAYKRYPIVLPGHPLTFKVTRNDNRQFGSDLGKVAGLKSLKFALLEIFVIYVSVCVFLYRKIEETPIIWVSLHCIPPTYWNRIRFHMISVYMYTYMNKM